MVTALMIFMYAQAAANNDTQPATVAGATGTLVINAAGFASAEGQAIIRVFNSDDGFPRDDDKAFRILKVKIVDGACTVELKDIPAAVYAILVIHDTNGNGKLDTNWIGFPDEPVGISNYPEPGRPVFDKAAVEVSAGGNVSVSVAVSEV